MSSSDVVSSVKSKIKDFFPGHNPNTVYKVINQLKNGDNKFYCNNKNCPNAGTSTKFVINNDDTGSSFMVWSWAKTKDIYTMASFCGTCSDKIKSREIVKIALTDNHPVCEGDINIQIPLRNGKEQVVSALYSSFDNLTYDNVFNNLDSYKNHFIENLSYSAAPIILNHGLFISNNFNPINYQSNPSISQPNTQDGIDITNKDSFPGLSENNPNLNVITGSDETNNIIGEVSEEIKPIENGNKTDESDSGDSEVEDEESSTSNPINLETSGSDGSVDSNKEPIEHIQANSIANHFRNIQAQQIPFNNMVQAGQLPPSPQQQIAHLNMNIVQYCQDNNRLSNMNTQLYQENIKIKEELDKANSQIKILLQKIDEQKTETNESISRLIIDLQGMIEKNKI